MKHDPRQELKFKRWFRQEFKGWSEAYEPRRGSGTGMPDLQLLVRGMLLPVELKVGWIEDDVLHIHDVEPAQVSWHVRFWAAGGESSFVVGIPDGKGWQVYSPFLSAAALMEWKKGWRAYMAWEIWAG